MPADLTVTRTRLPDLSERLPATANARLATLRQMRDDAAALLAGVNEQLADARLEKANADGALKALIEADEEGRLVTQREEGSLNHRLGQRKVSVQDRDTARIEVATSRLRRAEEALNTIVARQSALAARRNAFAALAEHCEQWAMQQPGPFDLADTAAPKLKRGENVVAAIERTRAALRELTDQRHQVSRAPLPTAEARQRIRQRVLNLADSVPSANINGILSAGLEAHQWPTRPLSIVTLTPTGEGEPVSGRGTARVPDITAILAVIAPEALISFLEARLPPDEGCLTDEQKVALLCELDRQILETERAESTLLFQAWEAGADILPRQDAAPAAVLAVTT